MSRNDLAPGLLLASTGLGDPNFERTVVLLARHDAEGALGWVLNGRPLAPVAELLRAAGLVPEGVTLPATPAFAMSARVGGPVAPASGWLVFPRRAGTRLTGELQVGPELAVSGDSDALDAVIRGKEPREFRLLLGYAGWAPGQLENEVRVGAWLPADVDRALVFETPAETLWDAAYKRTIGASPAAFTSSRRGSA